MNAKLQEFFEKVKAEKELQKREHLIELGLVDETRSTPKRIYSNVWEDGWNYDNENDTYYKDINEPAPIEVTDDEYNEILKYAPQKKANDNEEKKTFSTKYADTIKIIADFLFFVHIIGGFTLFIILDDYAFIAIIAALAYCLLYYPLLLGFSRIVAAAEKILQK